MSYISKKFENVGKKCKKTLGMEEQKKVETPVKIEEEIILETKPDDSVLFDNGPIRVTKNSENDYDFEVRGITKISNIPLNHSQTLIKSLSGNMYKDDTREQVKNLGPIDALNNEEVKLFNIFKKKVHNDIKSSHNCRESEDKTHFKLPNGYIFTLNKRRAREKKPVPEKRATFKETKLIEKEFSNPFADKEKHYTDKICKLEEQIKKMQEAAEAVPQRQEPKKEINISTTKQQQILNRFISRGKF